MLLFLKDSFIYRKIYKEILVLINQSITTERVSKMQVKENKSIFLDYLGDTPELRVLDFFIDNHFFDFPLTEIARESNVSYNSLTSFFSEWVEKKIVIKTRKVGKSDFYKINMENDFIKNLIKLDWALSKKSILEK